MFSGFQPSRTCLRSVTNLEHRLTFAGFESAQLYKTHLVQSSLNDVVVTFK